jgi:hypothetical protein
MNEEWTRQVNPILRVVTCHKRIGDNHYLHDIVLAIKIDEDEVLWYMNISGTIYSRKSDFFCYAEALINGEWLSVG